MEAPVFGYENVKGKKISLAPTKGRITERTQGAPARGPAGFSKPLTSSSSTRTVEAPVSDYGSGNRK
jgi:hypothetical protein